MYDLNVGGHIVFSRELLETEGTGIHFDITFVGGYIVAAEVANVRVDARADFAAVGMFTLFGTVVTDRTLRFAIDNGITRCIQFGFLRWRIDI